MVENYSGLYSSNGNGNYYTTLLTSEANDFFSKVHNGKNLMPLTLDDNYWEYWINPNLNEKDVKDFIKTGYTTDCFNAHPVTVIPEKKDLIRTHQKFYNP